MIRQQGETLSCPLCEGAGAVGGKDPEGCPTCNESGGVAADDPRWGDKGFRCCGYVGGCGGPCATFPCWELTT